MPREVLERKVRSYLKQSVALEEFWNTPVTAEALRAELERIARSTRFPDRLREIYPALDQDTVLVQEYFARPVVVDRLAQNFLAFDERIHAAAREEAEDLLEAMLSRTIDVFAEHPARSVVQIALAGEGRGNEADESSR